GARSAAPAGRGPPATTAVPGSRHQPDAETRANEPKYPIRSRRSAGPTVAPDGGTYVTVPFAPVAAPLAVPRRAAPPAPFAPFAPPSSLRPAVPLIASYPGWIGSAFPLAPSCGTTPPADWPEPRVPPAVAPPGVPAPV